MRKTINLPNVITALRIFGTISLLFIQPLTGCFFAIYTFSGLTDILDGYIARKTNNATELGALLDSVADLLYYSVMILRIFPTLWERLPWQIWPTVGVVLLIRLAGYVVAAVKYRRFAAIHTWANKATGLMVFLVPYMLATPVAVLFCSLTCVVGVLSSLEELVLHLTAKQYDPKTKSIVQRVLSIRKARAHN